MALVCRRHGWCTYPGVYPTNLGQGLVAGEVIASKSTFHGVLHKRRCPNSTTASSVAREAALHVYVVLSTGFEADGDEMHGLPPAI